VGKLTEAAGNAAHHVVAGGNANPVTGFRHERDDRLPGRQ
jgi:hypothetical protein